MNADPSGYPAGFPHLAEPTSEMLSCRGDALYIEGVDVVALADRVATPFFLFSATQIDRNIAALRDSFRQFHPATRVFYASKACSNCVFWFQFPTGLGDALVRRLYGAFPSPPRECPSPPCAPGGPRCLRDASQIVTWLPLSALDAADGSCPTTVPGKPSPRSVVAIATENPAARSVAVALLSEAPTTSGTGTTGGPLLTQ